MGHFKEREKKGAYFKHKSPKKEGIFLHGKGKVRLLYDLETVHKGILDSLASLCHVQRR